MNREQHIYRATLVGSVGNVALLTFKFFAGFVGNSSAMIADAIHSLSDFITDLLVLMFVRISAKPQDESHDYGHGKYETVATFFIGIALVLVAIGITVSGVAKISDWCRGTQLDAPGMLALWAAVISIIVKELLYRYTAWQGKTYHSKALIANAWHHRSDALSSVGTVLGIGGAVLLGGRWTILDPVASLVVAVLLMHIALRLLREGLRELTDGSLPEETEQEIMAIVQSFPAITEPHNLRTRRIGIRIAIEFHVRMDGAMTLHEAHALVTDIERRLKSRFGESSYVNIHMEPRKRETLPHREGSSHGNREVVTERAAELNPNQSLDRQGGI